MSDYGVRLEQALTARNVSVGALAQHLGVTYQAVKRVTDLKTKEFSASNHAQAAAFLNINPDWLLTGSGDMSVSTTTGLALSGKARQLGMLLDRIKDQDKRLEAFSYCVLVLTQNPQYKPPYLVPTATPLEKTQKPPERIPGKPLR